MLVCPDKPEEPAECGLALSWGDCIKCTKLEVTDIRKLQINFTKCDRNHSMKNIAEIKL